MRKFEGLRFDVEAGAIYRLKDNKRLGWKQSKGYEKFYHLGKYFYTHRAIWEYCHGEIPRNMQIDHINHIKTDNRIKNLRLVTNYENHRNIKLPKNNKTGVMGVYLCKISNKYRGTIRCGTKRISIGSHKTIKEAFKARQKLQKKCGYHENHGTCVV